MFHFSSVGIEPGSELVSTFVRTKKGYPITPERATVVDDSHIRFRGESMTLTPAALQIANEVGYTWERIAGPSYWRYNGNRLDQLQKTKGTADTEIATDPSDYSEIGRKASMLYASDVRARKLFDWLAERKNDVAETSVDRISQMSGLSRIDAIELAKQLAEIGVCEFIVGRKGWRSRVRWRFGVRSLGQAAASGNEETIEEIDHDLEEDVVDRQPLTDDAEKPTASVQGITLAQAKQGLAITYGVEPDAIEITIRG